MGLNIYEDLRPLRRRLAGFRFVIIVVFGMLVLRFWQLQIARGTTYQLQARANHVRPIPESAPRGLVLDRTGRIIAENRPSFNLTLSEDRSATLEALERLVPLPEDVDRDAVLRLARLGPALVKEDIGIDDVSRVQARQLELPGAHIQFVPRRYYPMSGLSAHVVGHVGQLSEEQLEAAEFAGAEQYDYVGQAGIERIYNAALMGENGVQNIMVNSVGRREGVLEQILPVWGESVQLSIDLSLHEVAQEEFGERAGAIVALDPRNGQVLALASFPAYDPNSFSGSFDHEQWSDLMNDERHPLSNRAIQGRYAPGSVFKLVMATAALEEGIITAETEMSCSGSVRLYGNVFHCARASGHGSVDLVEAIAQSCNSYFFRLAPKLPIETIARYARLFGLGKATEIDLPHEVSGLVPDPDWKRRARNEPWYAGETVSVAVGQGAVLVTAVQMAQLAGAVSTGGEIHHPRLFLRQLPSASPPEPFPLARHVPAARRLGLRPETYRVLQEGMFQAVNGVGTAGRARVAGVAVSGKTGTSQVAARGRIAQTRDEDRPEELRNHAWFVGYAPRENPEIAIAVLVEHAIGGGGRAAAPIAKAVLERHFENRRLRERDHARKTAVAIH